VKRIFVTTLLVLGFLTQPLFATIDDALSFALEAADPSAALGADLARLAHRGRGQRQHLLWRLRQPDGVGLALAAWRQASGFNLQGQRVFHPPEDGDAFGAAGIADETWRPHQPRLLEAICSTVASAG